MFGKYKFDRYIPVPPTYWQLLKAYVCVVLGACEANYPGKFSRNSTP